MNGDDHSERVIVWLLLALAIVVGLGLWGCHQAYGFGDFGTVTINAPISASVPVVNNVYLLSETNQLALIGAVRDGVSQLRSVLVIGIVAVAAALIVGKLADTWLDHRMRRDD